jgi:spermidine synthase
MTDRTPQGPHRPDATPREGSVEGRVQLMEASGFYDGRWFTEEDFGAIRLSMRVYERLHVERSEYQEIAVYDTGFFGRVLTLDDCVMFTERDEFVYHEMLTHVPLVTIPEPKDVLVIGGGDCGILREALKHPSITRAVQCEIDERVTAVCDEYFPWVDDVKRDPRTTLAYEDGVAFIERHAGEFDLIVIDSTDPVGPAVGLFQREFYAKVARALKPGGVMVAQTESPHWAAGVVSDIYREIGHAFDEVHAYMGYIPTYPSGAWCWAYASNGRTPSRFVDRERAARVAESCLYYNTDIQTAAFALPTFAARAMGGANPFERFDARNAELRRRS